MLIQGSAFVFGRKVDYVHSQAVHFFEALQPQKSKKKKKAGGLLVFPSFTETLRILCCFR